MLFALLLSSSLFPLPYSLSAAVPLKWTVETSRATPAQFEAYQGETLALEADLQSYGKPLELSGIAALYWQTNGMGSTYWEATAAVNSNRLSAVWTPEMDVGSKVYNCFIGIPGTAYHAAFQLRLRPSPGALPNVLPLPVPVIDFAKVRVLNPPWESGGGVNTNAVIDIIHKTVDGAARPLPPYLHALDFDDSYPAEAQAYYDQRQGGVAVPAPQCSAVRSGNFLYRNFDYSFDDRAEFIVKMSAGVQTLTANSQQLTARRYASIGVANVGTNLTESLVTSGKHSPCYKWLPGATVDGINEHGVVAEINVVDGDPQTSGWHNTGDLHPLAAVRWALDHATNAQHAATYLAANIRFPEDWQQNFHYMVADETSTYIVENGAAHPVPSALSPTGADQPVLTNFRLYPTHSTGEGQERYIALTNGADITSQWWTLTYTADGYRASDLPGITGEALTQLFDYWASKPREAHRGETFANSQQLTANSLTWWQTVHTSVYDITNRVLRVAVQETDDWYTFQVPSASDAALRRTVGALADSVSSLASRTGADITTGGGYTQFGYTDPENDISTNIQNLDGGIVESNERLDEFIDEAYDAFAQKEEAVANQDGEANDLTVNGMTVNDDATFNGNVNIGPNSLYLDGTLIEAVLGGYTPRGIFNSLNNDFETHKGNANIHVTSAQKSTWDAKLSSSDVIDPASATTTGKAADALKVKQALAEKLDKYHGVAGNMQVGNYHATPALVIDSGDNSYGSPTIIINDNSRSEDGAITVINPSQNLDSGSFINIELPSESGTLSLTSDIPAPYTPPSYLRVYDEVRQCWWIGRMVNGVINWEVE